MENKNLIPINETVRGIEDSLRTKKDETVSEHHSDDCNLCHGFGYVYPLTGNGKPDYSRVVNCKCIKDFMERERIERVRKICELPAMTEAWTFDNFQRIAGAEAAFDAAVDLAEERSGIKWLTLTGGVDQGKSHLAIAICRRWLQRGKVARYGLVPLLLEELKRGFNRQGDESYESRYDFLMNVPLLVLDDLGTENPTPWVNEKLDTIVDYRYVQGLPLVVTTNLSMKQLPMRIASRLQRAEFSRVISIDAPEYRLRSLGGK